MKQALLLHILISICTMLQAQSVGVGTTSPHTSALMELKSANKGFLFPRTSTSTRLSIPPVKGLFVYDTTFNNLYYHNGAVWQQVSTGSSSNHWSIFDNNVYNNNTGNVGIGTSLPAYKLTVNGDMQVTGNTPTLRLTGDADDVISRVIWELPQYTDDYNIGQYQSKFYISRAIGTLGLTTDIVVSTNGYIGMGTASPSTKLQIIGGTDVGNTTGGYIQFGADGTTNIAIDNNEIQSRDANGVAKLTINAGGGAVQIGNATVPLGYLVGINGKVICEELKIQDSGQWPDYVFSADYALRSFDELRSFIGAEKHLPGIPDAQTVEREGIEIGEMQKGMMEKIEELTLYILQLEQRNGALEQRVQMLEGH